MKIDNKNLWFGTILVFLFDQVTKIWALNRLPFSEEVVSKSWFSLYRIYNESTIMLNLDAENYNISVVEFRLIYAVIAVCLTLGILWVTNQPALNENKIEAELAKSGLFIILGAMLGNLTDRIFRQGVIDFIKLDMFENTVPILNIADIMIYVGVFAIIIAWVIIIFKIIKNCFSFKKK